ncbi:Beta-galactosidase [Microbacterium sp. C448]|uniref:glycoside hydrolase family 35 protein n=1 Tax=Microbacterium TaxID=33882 RepID=UPI0003DE5A15|nr:MULTISPECIES: beta-galactosidase family protein [Microbacterium]CDK01428.1 Beta-galactosidase [Microbacterium sp. C448]
MEPHTLPTFQIGDQDFLLDGQPHRILSGALHYFRVHPEQWADRIHKARLMGLNTIETYVAWNAHAPSQGEWDVTGGLDLGRFLDLVAAEGMHAIVRPGPYICAEWDNGGLPAWLFRDEQVGVRRLEPLYVAAVTDYLQRVYEIITPRQIEDGGPVILVQIENEYGAYGADKQYLTELVRVTREAGITVPLTTVDQPIDQMLIDGSIPGVHMTASFGSRTTERLATLRKHQPTGPLMCMEFWNGWFDDWGTHHHTTDPELTARDLDAILSVGGSVNFYMFHGGTNFGLTNGANDKGRYAAITTSYDYDAPLDEAGNPTEKYFAFRDVIARYAPIPDEVPSAPHRVDEFSTPLSHRSNLLPLASSLGVASRHDTLPTFDDLAHDRGIAIFTTTLHGNGPGLLSFDEVRDRAWIFLDGAPVGVLARDAHEQAIVLTRSTGELVIIVEDQGRVNYGPRIGEHKGLIGGGRLDGEPIIGWTAIPLDLDRVPAIEVDHDDLAVGPVIARGTFELTRPCDLFLDTRDWGKGFAWINGFALGRYWRRGPQRTLYVPEPVLRSGQNELVILELEVLTQQEAVFAATPLLGHEDF